LITPDSRTDTLRAAREAASEHFALKRSAAPKSSKLLYLRRWAAIAVCCHSRLQRVYWKAVCFGNEGKEPTGVTLPNNFATRRRSHWTADGSSRRRL